MDYKANKYTGLPYDSKKKIFLQLLSLEEWYFINPTIHEMLNAKVISKLQALGIDIKILNDIPYFIVSIEQFELDFQLTHILGIKRYYNELVNNKIQKTRQQNKLVNIIKDDLDRDFFSKVGVKI